MQLKLLSSLIICSVFFLTDAYAQSAMDCSQFKTGTFVTTETGRQMVIIKRTKRYQTEIVPEIGGKIKLRIKWIDDCSYTLKFLKVNKVIKELYGGIAPPKLITSKIIEVEGLEYTCESRVSGYDDIIDVIKIRKQVDQH